MTTTPTTDLPVGSPTRPPPSALLFEQPFHFPKRDGIFDFFSLAQEIRDLIYYYLLSLSAREGRPSWPSIPSQVLPMGFFCHSTHLSYLFISPGFTLELLNIFRLKFRHRLEAYRQYSPQDADCYPTFITHNHHAIRHLDIRVYSEPDAAPQRPKLQVCSSLSVWGILKMMPHLQTMRLELTLLWQGLYWTTNDLASYQKLLAEEIESANRALKVMRVFVQLAGIDYSMEDDPADDQRQRGQELLTSVQRTLGKIVKVDAPTGG